MLEHETTNSAVLKYDDNSTGLCRVSISQIKGGNRVCGELDRAFGKKYSPSMTVGMSPCLKTQLKYLFVISTDDLQLPDAERAYFRWILPQERCALQGVHPRLALHLCNSDLLHALGNAYPVPLIAACGAPVLQMIEKWGRLNSWPPPLSPGDLLELPDVAGHFLPLLTAKPKKESKPKSKSEPKPKLSPKKGKVRKKISKPSLRSAESEISKASLRSAPSEISKPSLRSVESEISRADKL